MTTRFEAEEIIRAAASGAIPAPGDVLLRVQDGWVFAQLSEGAPGNGGGGGGAGPVRFIDLIGVIFPAQVPVGVVTQHEGALSISFNQMTDQILDSQVPFTAVLQHVRPALSQLEFLMSRAVSKRPRTPIEKLHSSQDFI